MSFCVYVVTHVESGRRYVGKTSDFERRWREHTCYATKWKRQRTSHLHSAMAKYGVDAFEHRLLATFDDEQRALDREKVLVEFLQSNVRGYGFNIESGGDSGKSMGEETKRKISETKKSQNRRLSDEEKAAKSAAALSSEALAKHNASQRGKKMPEWQRAKIAARMNDPDVRARVSAARSGVKWSDKRRAAGNLSLVGRKHSDETKAKMSASQQGRKPTEETRTRMVQGQLRRQARLRLIRALSARKDSLTWRQ